MLVWYYDLYWSLERKKAWGEPKYKDLLEREMPIQKMVVESLPLELNIKEKSLILAI